MYRIYITKNIHWPLGTLPQTFHSTVINTKMKCCLNVYTVFCFPSMKEGMLWMFKHYSSLSETYSCVRTLAKRWRHDTYIFFFLNPAAHHYDTQPSEALYSYLNIMPRILSMILKAKWVYWSHLLVSCTKAKILSLIHVLKTVQWNNSTNLWKQHSYFVPSLLCVTRHMAHNQGCQNSGSSVTNDIFKISNVCENLFKHST